MRRPILLFLIATCVSSSSFGQKLVIGYTGDLDGYYRKDMSSNTLLPAASRLMTDADGLSMLLGMGNNFGPEFGASVQKGTGAFDPVKFPVSYYKGIQGNDVIVADSLANESVASALNDIGFTALVPGQDDFIYGGVWLKQISKLLPANGKPANRTRLLAANLVVTFPDGTKPTKAQACPLLFSDETTWNSSNSCDSTLAPIANAGGAYLIMSRIAVVAVVDPDLLDHVAARHQEFLAEDEETKVKIATSAPVDAIVGALTAAGSDPDPFDSIVVMAQMDRLKAEVLGARLQQRLQTDKTLKQKRLLLIISRADNELRSPVGQTISALGETSVPVLTPNGAYQAGDPVKTLLNPLNKATFETEADGRASLKVEASRASVAVASSALAETFIEELGKVGKAGAVSAVGKFDGTNCAAALEDCKKAVMLLLLSTLRASGAHPADLSLLARRDFFLDYLPKDYQEVEVCKGDQRCEMVTILDRILWRGDFARRVMVKGTELRSFLKSSSKMQKDETQKLNAYDTSGEWLVTFGITQPGDTALSLDAEPSKESLCTDEENDDAKTYCIDRLPIADDFAYWVVTSDDVLEDSPIFKPSSLENSKLRVLDEEKNTFLSSVLANAILNSKQKARAKAGSLQGSGASGSVAVEAHESSGFPVPSRRPWELDIAKLVGGFSVNGTDGGDAVSDSFGGVQDARAAQVFTHQVDFEAKLRSLFHIDRHLAVGFEGDASLFKTRVGSLGDTDHPKTISWGANDTSYGGLVQYELLPDIKSLHSFGALSVSKFNVVFRLQGNRTIEPTIFYGKVKDQVDSTKTDSLQTNVDTNWGLVLKGGLRLEAGHDRWWQLSPETYIDFGFQASHTNHLLSNLYLNDPSHASTPACTADVATTLSDCLKALTGTATSTISPGYADDLGTRGLYWDIHLLKKFNDTLSINADSLGNAYLWPTTKTLSTQSFYAIPLTAAFNVKLHSNFSLSPSFTGFYYETQPGAGGVKKDLFVRGFTVTLKYYFSKETRVPFPRGLLFDGPKSKDETSSMKLSK